MTVETLSKALEGFDAKLRTPIFEVCSKWAPAIHGRGLDRNMILAIAHEISQVSGGSGLSVLSLLMWADDEIPDFFSDMAMEIQECLRNYNPGQVYGVTPNADVKP